MTENTGRLKNAITQFIKDLGISKLFMGGFKTWIEDLEQEGYKYLNDMYSKLGVSDKIPDYLKPHGTSGIFRSAQFDILTVIGAIFGVILAAIGAVFRPIVTLEGYKLEHVFNTFRPPYQLALQMLFRNREHQDKLQEALADQGVDPVYQQMIYKSYLQRPGIQELLTLWRRGLISAEELGTFAEEAGIDPNHLNYYQALTNGIPGPSDLTRMAVREAWNDETSARFQYDNGLPPEFVEWMDKQGFNREWSTKYWRAHWELPSLSAAYEMLHRLRPGKVDEPFTLDDMELLLKTQDIPEYFRKRLIAISYNPYTRVDVRRLYAFGIVTEDGVYQNYLDLGYDDEHAKALTKFTTTTEAAEEKGLTTSTVTAAYRRGLISREDAVKRVQDIGYNATDADFIISNIDYDIKQDDLSARLDDISTRFINGEIDETGLSAALGPLNLPTDQATRLQTEWSIKRRAKIKKPSRADLEGFYDRDLITQDALRAGLIRDGFNSADAETFIRRIDLDKANDAEKEAARARTEADRTAASAAAKESSKAQAALDAQIAEYNLENANIKVALHQDLTPDQIDALKARQDEILIAIAQLRLDKANIRAGA